MEDLAGLSRFLASIGTFLVAVEILSAIGVFSTLLYIFLTHKAKPPKALFCTDCGARLEEPSYYCVECGSKQ